MSGYPWTDSHERFILFLSSSTTALPSASLRRTGASVLGTLGCGPVAPTGVSTGVIEEGAIHDVGDGREQ